MSVLIYNGKPLVSKRYLEQLLGSDRSTLAQLAQESDRFYRPFSINQVRKDGSTKVRKIDNPRGAIREIQTRIHRRLLRSVRLPGWILGGVKGRTIKDNADLHAGAALVVKLDIANFFPSVSVGHVRRTLRTHLGASSSIRGLLAELLTLNGRLPQGSPASTTIANMVLSEALNETVLRLQAQGLTTTAWVDDITVSGPEAHGAIGKVIGALGHRGFRTVRSKMEVLRRGQSIAVTGLFLNERGATVGLHRKKALRRLRHRGARGSQQALRSADGLASFVAMVSRQDGGPAWLNH